MKIYYENGKPVINVKNDDVEIIITFKEDDLKENKNLKDIIVNLLTASYENRITS